MIWTQVRVRCTCEYLFKDFVERVGVVEDVSVKDQSEVSCRRERKGESKNKGTDKVPKDDLLEVFDSRK